MNRRVGYLLALLAAAEIGCGTISRGRHQTIVVQSEPPEASVFEPRSGETFTTPAHIELERGRSHKLTVSKEGYASQEIYLRPEANFGVWFIDAFTLGIANLVDAATGGLFDLKPAQVQVVLDRSSVGSESP